jgi:hypothetical protein
MMANCPVRGESAFPANASVEDYKDRGAEKARIDQYIQRYCYVGLVIRRQLSVVHEPMAGPAVVNANVGGQDVSMSCCSLFHLVNRSFLKVPMLSMSMEFRRPLKHSMSVAIAIYNGRWNFQQPLLRVWIGTCAQTRVRALRRREKTAFR